MAAQPQVFTNAAKATALANAQAALAGNWQLRETGNQEAANAGMTGGLVPAVFERWMLPFGAGKIDLVLLPGGATWQATLYPGS